MLRTPSLNLLLQIKDGDRCEWIDTRDTMEPTLGRVIGAFTTAATVATLMITGVDHQAVEAGTKDQKAYTTWSDYEGSADSAQYSSLTQINKSNVAKLRQMWFYPAGNNGFRFGFNPLVVDGVMYVVGKNNATVALDAVTGKEIWVHDNGTPRNITNRGINYWESKDRSDRRLFYSSNNILHALDARTGKPVDSFGDHGNVDLREGLGRDPKTMRAIESGTPGRVFENLLILGSATGEEYNSPPGDIRAYDVLTGKMVWIFHTVPHPGEFGYDTWPKDAWKYIGGTNDWGGMTIDEKRGIAYFPLGSPTYDFYGADRTGAGLFGNCLLALDARTGKYLWHFQAVHHDLFDYDLTTSPKLLTVKHDGKMVDIVAVGGKNGFLYVFDRVTGKPIWPIVERPVPQSDMPGEHSWPTQPFPTAPPPFATQSFTPDDVDPYISDAAERAKIKQQLQNARNEGIFTPAGLKDTVEMPGNNGGGNWGGGAVDPPTGTLYIEAKNAPSMIRLEPNPPKRQMTGSAETEGRILYIQNCQSCHTAELTGQPPSIPSLVDVVSRISADRVKSTIQNGASPMPAFISLSEKEVDALIAYLSAPSKAHVPPDILAYLSTPRPPPPPAPGAPATRYWTGYGYMNSSEGLPANKPPWSTLTAYDLNKGTIKWQIPLGEVTELAARGIKDTGSYWPRGGVVVTAGGLIFSGTISDTTIRAYDKDTGKVLWEQVMPAGPEGIPAVFEVNGQEYLALSARPSLKHLGPGGERATVEPAANAPQTQGFYVFALPKSGQK
jgi:quinoprotein glucose dehydrogenase